MPTAAHFPSSSYTVQDRSKHFFTEQVLRMVSGNGNYWIIISECSQRIITEILQVQHQQGLGQMNLEGGY